MLRFLPLFILLTCISCKSKKAILTEDFKISMKKGSCFGSCPVYKLEINKNGLATFTGERFTDKFGEHTLELDSRKMEEVTAAFDNSDLAQYKDVYESSIQDLPTITLSYTNEGNTKTIVGKRERPAPVRNLQKLLEDIVKMEGWVPTDPTNVEETEEEQEETDEEAEEDEPEIIENEFIIKFKNGTWLSRWVKDYNAYGLRVSKPLSDDQMTWLVRYKKDTIEPEAFMAKLQSDSAIESVEYNTK